jgi:hypothetical protein
MRVVFLVSIASLRAKSVPIPKLFLGCKYARGRMTAGETRCLMCRKGSQGRNPARRKALATVYREPPSDYLEAKHPMDTLTADRIFTIGLT